MFDDTCYFLAVDFDGEIWPSDALALTATCRDMDVPAALERSRSEEGLKWPDTEERLVRATRRHLGEGFDDASLDTLFLTGYRSLGYEIAATVAPPEN